MPEPSEHSTEEEDGFGDFDAAPPSAVDASSDFDAAAPSKADAAPVPEPSVATPTEEDDLLRRRSTIDG